MERKIEFLPLLSMVQEYISSNYSAVLNNDDKAHELMMYIDKFINLYEYKVTGYTTEHLVIELFNEMSRYSILTDYLHRKDIEEININSWDDIAITYTNGNIEKMKKHFYSPQHAIDIVKRLLHHSGVVIDNAEPMAQGHLPDNIRVTALKSPIVDDSAGVSVSIRLLHPTSVTIEDIISFGNATRKMIDFLAMCVNYGVSTVVAGATSSGKTTFLNALLSTVPDNKRIFTIESGAREFSLVKRDEDGNVINNVVQTLSRPSDNEIYNISQEDLVVAALRFNPDVICVGEMRDVECSAAVEASMTGHTVVSTVHATSGAFAHWRIALLCQKRFPIDFNLSLMQSEQAFPLIVYSHKMQNNDRKIMDISECEMMPDGSRKYRTLFRYHVIRNDIIDGRFVTEGYFEQPEIMSESLQKKLLQFGVPYDELSRFLEKGADYE